MPKKLNYPLIFLLLFCAVILSLIYTVSLTQENYSESQTSYSQTVTSAGNTTADVKVPFAGIKDIDTLLDSIIMNAPHEFTSPEKADKDELVKIAFWCLLMGENPDSFDFEKRKMLLKSQTLEQMYCSLFEETDFPAHKTITSQGVTFSYNKNEGTYSVPITGITPLYTIGKVSSKNKNGKVKIKAELIPSDKWTQNAKGEIITPKAQMQLTITVRKQNDGSLSLLNVSYK